jgi:cytochrome bd-type quinol oxidase subunit 2
MADVKKKLKKFGRYTWELFKDALPSLFMYLCASMILLMLTLRGEKIEWNNNKLMWSIVCAVGGLAYTGLIMWACGGQHYEMLVSGNIKRATADAYGMSYKISSHKEAKEYREWKGFVIGAFMAILPIVTAIVFGCNQTAIDGKLNGGGLAIIVLLSFLLSGWTILPFYYMNHAGIHVSYFLSGLLGLLPVIVAGVFYIVGAYARRNKTVRQQEIADRAAAAQANREKKINYGGLPGTKPKKRK